MVQILNRSTPHGKRLIFADATLDLERRRLTRDGTDSPLRPKAMDLLIFLASRPGKLASKDDILKAVWRQTVVTPDSITQCVIEIRRALGDDDHVIVRTVPTQGYLLDVPVREVDGQKDKVDAADDGGSKPEARPRFAYVLSAAVFGACALVLMVLLGTWSKTSAPLSAEVMQASPRAAGLAVLPFEDLSQDGDYTYFADGLAHEVIHKLSSDPKLRVIASNSSFTFRDRRPSFAKIASELDVSHVLSGAIRVEDSDIRVTVQLIETQSGNVIWSKAFDRHVDNAVAVQSEIALSVAQTLTEASRDVTADATPNVWRPGAYAEFLKGQFYFARRTDGDVERSRVAFERSVELDPNHARTWAGLAGSLWISLGQEQLPQESGLARFRMAAERALELDPNLVEAHVRLGNYWYATGHVSRAQAHWASAEKTDPNNTLLLSVLAGNAFFDGDMDTAIRLQKKAASFDPVGPFLRSNLASYYVFAGRLDEARAEYAELLELDPNRRRNINTSLAEIAMLQGYPDKALSLLRKSGEQTVSPLSAMVLWAAGEHAAADRMLETLIAKSARNPSLMVDVAKVYAQRDDSDSAASWLARSAASVANGDGDDDFLTKCTIAFYARHSPFLRSIQADPRVENIVAQLASIAR